MAVDIGAPANYEARGYGSGYTFICFDNPANEDGVLDTIQVAAYQNITGLRVGTFYLVSGTTYKCRDSVLLGDIVAGATRTFNGLSVNVVAGDFIGCYYTGGMICYTPPPHDGVVYYSGEAIDPGDQQTYATWDSDECLNLYGFSSVVAAFVGSRGFIIG